MITQARTSSSLQVWSVSTAEEVCTLVGHTAPIRTLVLNAEETILATGDDFGVVMLWSTHT